MADKIPIRGGFNGASLTGLAQFASGDTLGVAHGGTGVVTIGSNALVTGNGTSAMTSESNLTFDGTILKSTGDLCATVKVVAPALCIGSEYVLPTADGSAGQLMCTDGSGALAFATAPSSGISFNGSTANGVATYSSSTVADVESMLTFASPVLTIGASSTAELRLQGHGTNDVKGISIYAGGDFPVLEQYTLGLNWSGGTIEYDALNTFDHAFQIAGTTKLIITSGGKVGIGTATPDSTLHVFTASAGAASPATNADDLVVENSAAGGISILTPDANDGILKFGSPTLDYNGSISVNHNSASPYMDFNVNSAARMRITSTGLVGIGTAAPAGKLHVSQTTAGVWTGRFDNNQTDGPTLYVNHTGGSSTTNSALRVDAASVNVFEVKSDGKVGIGTFTPADKFHIYNSPQAWAKITGTGTGNDHSGWQFQTDSKTWVFAAAHSNSTTVGSNRFYWYEGGILMTLNSSGNLVVCGSLSKGSGSFTIDHPLESKKDTHKLVHSFIEGPQADLIYSGITQLSDGTATLNVDTEAGMTEGTFDALNRCVRVFTSNESNWDAVRGSVTSNVLTIESNVADSTACVSWMVIGERHDQHMLDTEWTDSDGKVIVEPEKTE